MGKPTGFLEHGRELPRRRPVPVRVRDWHEVYEPFTEPATRTQAARCMDCGIPFCHDGCPLGNLVPEWNDLVYRARWFDASERLHATNNFPEMTGRLCPAPCEAACVLGISDEPVTIERIELEVAERAFEEGWVTPVRSAQRSGRHVAIVGSGPAGLACAQQLARAGHRVTVYERAERPGGLLRYGIPEFKMRKQVLDRRLEQLRAEGVEFVCSTVIGAGSPGGLGPAGGAAAPRARTIPARQLLEAHDAVVLATGSTVPRDLPVPGRHLAGVHVAMEYLKPANLVQEGALRVSPVDARGRRVVIVGGGDTGADCLGTAHRQGAASVVQLEIMPEPPRARAPDQPWPLWPTILRRSAAHEEGGAQEWSVTPTELLDDGSGRVGALRAQRVRRSGGGVFEPVPGDELVLDCDLVLLAMGFLGPEPTGVVGELGVELDGRGTIAVATDWSTSVERVFACGDAARGQSLVVWAIAEGRSAAAAVDRWLMGTTALPAPVRPGQVALR